MYVKLSLRADDMNKFDETDEGNSCKWKIESICGYI